MNFNEQNVPSIDAFSKVKSPRYKSKSWKAGQRKGRVWARPFSFKNRAKRERKVWTKGKERHKRRWIIQYAPLVDSFVILYNGPLEKNQLIAWKRSLFSVTPRINVMRKMSQFCCKYLRCPYRWSVNPAGGNWPTFFGASALYAQPSRAKLRFFWVMW